MSIADQWDIDATRIYHYILHHPQKNTIVPLYIKGPNRRDGFLYWNEPIIEHEVKDVLHNLGYDGAAYALMQKKVQAIVRKYHQL